MKTTRKILLALVLTLAVAAVMSVCAFAAFDLDVELPAGVVKGDAEWVDSGYADIDAEGSGWIMIAKTGRDYSGTTEAYPKMATADSGRFYWNKATDKGVYVVTSSNMSANWADWTPVSAANPTAADQKKMYAFASAFVDEMFGYYGSGAYQKALGGDVPADSEASVYVNGSKVSSYTVYKRYVNDYKKASAQWTNFAVTKASYDSFVAKKAELEAAGTTGETLEDALVEFVYANFAGYKMARNVKENGSFVMLTWVWQTLSEAGYVFDTVEFRTKQTSAYFSTFGLATRALDADTVLFEDVITRLALTEADRGFLYDMDTLTTFAHVDFNDDGTYTGTVTEGVIDLRGFDTITPYKTPAQYTSYLLRSSAAIKEVIWFDSILANGEEVAGIIDQIALRDCTALETFTVPASVTLTEIKANAFNGCKALKVIDVKGVVSPEMKIDASAFTGVSGLTIKVYSDLDKENMEKALTAAGVSATVETTKVEESDGGETVSIPNVITADGFMLRTQSYNGLRALFSFDEDKAAAVAQETGYTLVEYGAVAASAANYTLAGSAEALLGMANGKSIQRIVIFADDDTGLNKYVDVDEKQYCIAVRDFAGANTLKEIYVAGYAIWSNGTDTVITSSEYVTKAGKNTISLYTLTLEMFKAGVINSQMADEICVWDVLKNGAFSVTEAETKAPSALLTLTQGYEYDAEGKFTYVDLPLRAWNMYKNASGNTVWNSRGVTVEETATTGILWSVLVDGDNLVVVYRADEAFDGTATLPKLSDNYGVSAPFSEKYFGVTAESQVVTDPTANGLLKTATIYSPIFTTENSAKIKTIVVDYGVDKFGQQSLSSASATTIVYPEGMTSDTYLLSGCKALKNFTYATADKTYLDAYDVSSLVDLTGLEKISDYGLAMDAAEIENILLPEADKIKNGQQYGFSGARALSRVWTVGFDMPEAGVMDLSQTGIKMICKGYFNNLDSIDDIYMPESFTAVSAYSMATLNQKTDTARWNVFGNNSSETKLNIHVANWNALNCIANTFYEARQNIDYNDGKEGDPSGIAHIVDYLQITYDGVTKTVLEWRADFPAQPAA